MNKMYSDKSLKLLLDYYYKKYHHPSFIANDPIQVASMFKNKEDVEIASFFTTLIAWGKRKQIIKNAKFLMSLMDNKPYDFIINIKKKDINRFYAFKHRTINGNDIIEFLWVLHKIYQDHGGLENLFTDAYKKYNDIYFSLKVFYTTVSSYTQNPHCLKHISNVSKNSAAKRLNLFLRWMVREDDRKVDFGLWKSIPPSALYIPLDVHVSNVARKLGILKCKQNNWKAVQELTENLRYFDKNDPIKYDFALFGMGLENVNCNFIE
ncbi:MAG: TIGR02757 family protein [Bacteroidales bacterium]